MQGMNGAVGIDRALRRRQGLAQNLAAEHIACADVAALAAEQVFLEALQLQQFDKFADDGIGHWVLPRESPKV